MRGEWVIVFLRREWRRLVGRPGPGRVPTVLGAVVALELAHLGAYFGGLDQTFFDWADRYVAIPWVYYLSPSMVIYFALIYILPWWVLTSGLEQRVACGEWDELGATPQWPLWRRMAPALALWAVLGVVAAFMIPIALMLEMALLNYDGLIRGFGQYSLLVTALFHQHLSGRDALAIEATWFVVGSFTNWLRQGAVIAWALWAWAPRRGLWSAGWRFLLVAMLAWLSYWALQRWFYPTHLWPSVSSETAGGETAKFLAFFVFPEIRRAFVGQAIPLALAALVSVHLWWRVKCGVE